MDRIPFLGFVRTIRGGHGRFGFRPLIRLLCACCFCCLTGGSAAFATSIIFPTFSQPVSIEDKVFVVSPERDRVLGVDQTGKLLWDRPFPKTNSLFVDRKGALRVSHAGAVCVLDPGSGKVLSTLPINAAIKEVGYNKDGHLLLLSDPDWKKAGLTLLDADEGKPLHTESDAEYVVHADKDRVVFVKSRRIVSPDSYQFNGLWLEAKSRADWRGLWKIDLQQRTPWLTARMLGGELCVPDVRDLLLIDPDSGGYRRVAPKIEDAAGMFRWELRMDGDRFYYLSNGPRSSADYNATVHRIHWCVPPDLEVIEVADFKVIEAVTVSRYDQVFVSDALYRTAGFDLKGAKLWEMFQMTRTEPVDGWFYFCDHKEQVARLGRLEIATGKHTILHSERLR